MWWDEVEEMLAYWRNHPPTHLLVAGALGFKPEEKPRTSTEQEVLAFAMFARGALG